MQVATDILRVLIFPGLLFMAMSGNILLLFEGRVRSALYGGASNPFLRGGVRQVEQLPLAQLLVMAISLTSLGAAGFMLVAMRGNLFMIVILLAAVELLPISLRAEGGQRQAAYIPIVFRGALIRIATLFLVATTVSLRYPGSFTSELETFREGSSFKAASLWSGYHHVLILAALVLGLLALLAFHLGRPAYTYLQDQEKRDAFSGAYFILAQGAQRAITILLFLIIFLGYPWMGWSGIGVWSGAALGIAGGLALMRAWSEGRDRVTLRRWQFMGIPLALTSLVIALIGAF